jgi:hypothetical protein
MPSTRLHFGKSTSHKTIIGGICTIIASLLFLILATYQGYHILKKTQPYVNTQEDRSEYYKDEEIWKMGIN